MYLQHFRYRGSSVNPERDIDAGTGHFDKYDMDTGTAGTGADFHAGAGHFGKFGTTSIPLPDTSVSSVRHQYRYRRYRCGRFDRS